MHRTTKKLMIVAAVVIAMAAYFFLDLGRYLSLAYLQQQLDIIHSFYAENRLLSWLIFLVVYVVVTALFDPRRCCHDVGGRRYFRVCHRVGPCLLRFGHRCHPGLSGGPLPVAGMGPTAFWRPPENHQSGHRKRRCLLFVYPAAGTGLSILPNQPGDGADASENLDILLGQSGGECWRAPPSISTPAPRWHNCKAPGDILSPRLIGAFVLLGLFPWIARALLSPLQRAKVYRGWKKPKHFDRNLIVIGAGSGGLVSAYIGATVKAGVTLVEKESMGGDCL